MRLPCNVLRECCLCISPVTVFKNWEVQQPTIEDRPVDFDSPCFAIQYPTMVAASEKDALPVLTMSQHTCNSQRAHHKSCSSSPAVVASNCCCCRFPTKPPKYLWLQCTRFNTVQFFFVHLNFWFELCSRHTLWSSKACCLKDTIFKRSLNGAPCAGKSC